jgi:hypothetical protein
LLPTDSELLRKTSAVLARQNARLANVQRFHESLDLARDKEFDTYPKRPTKEIKWLSPSLSTMSRRRTGYPENCCWLPLSAEAQYSQSAKIEGLFVRHRNIGDQGAHKSRVAKIGRLPAEAS